MKTESVAFGVAGILFGLIAGWIIGSQQTALRPPTAAPPVQQQAAAPAAPETTTSDPAAPPAAILDDNKVNAFKTIADKEPSNVEARVQLGNLYFDAEKYDDATKWYGEALKLKPDNVDVSTDLGVCYYYTNQPDKALAQFDRSLKLDPKHAKTLLNVGIVKAFGKQDLPGAMEVWQQVIALAPDSPEGQAAKRALDAMRSSHPGAGGAGGDAKPGV